MVKIKLMRTGRTGIPFYRVVAVEAKTKRDGKYIEKLGLYNPAASPKTSKKPAETSTTTQASKAPQKPQPSKTTTK